MRLLHAILLLPTLTMTNANGQTFPSPQRWVGTWACAQQRVDPSIAPPPPGLANATLRQVVRCSIGGKRIRVRLANDFGTSELRVAAVHVAKPRGASGPRGAIDASTDRPLTFADESFAVVPAGASLLSDPVDFDVPALGDVAVTMRLDSVDETNLTTHPGARCTSFVVPGDAVSAATFENPVTSEHWYYLSGIDVVGDGLAIVALGDSITDGRGTTTDGNTRWTDALAARLQANAATKHLAVLNAGIGGNAVLHGGLGPTALAHFDRDVLAPAGAQFVIVFEGVNDLGGTKPGDGPRVARALIAGYGQMIERARARGMTVIGGTITPFAGSQYDTPEHEAARQAVNAWVRDGGAFDAVADFDAAVRDGARLQAEFDAGDHLHLNDAGYRAIADAVDLSIFEDANKSRPVSGRADRAGTARLLKAEGP